MTSQEAKQLLPVITALANGEPVDVKIGGRWCPIATPTFDLSPEHYRVAPKPREFWLVARDSNSPFIVWTQNPCGIGATHDIIHVREVLTS